MQRLKGLFILNTESFGLIYGPAQQQAIGRHVDLLAPPQTRDSITANRALLRDVDVIFSGWGGPLMDEVFLEAAPRLKVFFYGAGTVGYCITDALLKRDILVTTANAANALPVAEYTLATILFSLKHGWSLSRKTREQRQFINRDCAPGSYGSTVGLVSLGTIGRAVLRLLKSFDLKVIVYDPFLSPMEVEALGVESVTLSDIFRRSDVVSLHTPVLPETRGLITGKHISSMKFEATFINTARGELIREQEMLEVAARRQDIQFVLDVADPEPPPTNSPLYTLPNVLLTPHIAGSAGGECRRMGTYMVEELERYVAGEPLKWAINTERIHLTTNRPLTLTTFVKPKHSTKEAVVQQMH